MAASAATRPGRDDVVGQSMPAPVEEDAPPPATTQPVRPGPGPGPDPEVMPPAPDEPGPDGDDRFACFAAGTLIHARGGQVPVEAIRPGAMVMTADHGFAPVRWAGRRTTCGLGAMAPVLIEAGALGNARDLLVSPMHRMLISGARAELLFGSAEVLVAAAHLVDGRRVRRAPRDRVTYVHILFDAHEIVFAEGIASESFHPGDWGLGALEAAQREEVLALFPRLRAGVHGYGPAARASLRPWEARLLGAA